MRGIFAFFLSLSLFFVMNSCDEETPLPELEVFEPQHGFQVDPGDTIEVRLKARAGAGIEELHFSIVGGDNTEAVPSHRIELEGDPELEGRFPYPIDGGPDGGSGSHELRVTVVDGEGERRSAFVQGTITGDPVEFEKAFILLRPQEDRVEVHEITGPDQGSQLFKTLNQDFAASALSNVHRELIVAGSHTGDLRAIDPFSGQELWSVENQGASPYPYFLDLTVSADERYVFTPLGTERLEGYRGGNGPDITVEAIDDAFIRSVALWGGRLLTEQEPVGNEMRQWVTYYPSTGSIEEQIQIPDRDVVDILPASEGRVLVLMNENGEGHLEHYHVQGRYFDQSPSLPSFPPGKLIGGTQMGESRNLLVHDQGLWVQEEGSSMAGRISSSVPQALAYDRVNDRIFVGEGSELRVLEGDEGNELWSRSFQDSIQGLHILYSD